MRLLKSSQTILVTLISVLLNLSCSEKLTTSPEEGETGSEGFALETTENIGTQGGTIFTDEFSLTVPAGSFNQQTEIKLYSADSSLFGEETVTKFFKLEGLPSVFTTPLRIALKYTRPLKNESYIAVSEDVIDEFTGELETIYNLKDAVDSAGYLVGYLEPSLDGLTLLNLNKNTSPNSENDKNVQAVSNYSKEYRSDNFRFINPEYYNGTVQKFASTLEKNYEIIKNSLKLSISKGKDPDGLWRIEIHLSEGGISRSSQALLIIHKDMLEPSSSSEFEIRSGQELINIATREYYPNNDDYSPGDHWLSYALITWSAELFSSIQDLIWPDDYHPSYTELEDSYFYSAFNGIRAGAGDGFRELYKHSVDMSALFKYLFDNNKLKKEQVGEIYGLIKEGENTTHALIKTTTGSKDDWWPDFLKQYISSNIYNVNSPVFVSNPDREWSITSDNDEGRLYGPEIGEYPDLSAKRFIVNLNHPTIDESKNLLVNITGSPELSAFVFGYKDSEISFFKQSIDGKVQIPNLRGLYDDGVRQFLLVAVKSGGDPPYTRNSPVYLSLQVKTSNALDYTICKINVKIDRVAGTTTLQEGDSFEDAEAPFSIAAPPYSYIGSFSGNIFVGTATETIGGSIFTGTIAVQLNDSYDMVTYVEFTKETLKDIDGSTDKINIEFKAKNISLTQQSKYEVLNDEVCSKTISVSYHETYDDPSYGFVSDFTTPYCDNSTSEDYIRIEFSK